MRKIYSALALAALPLLGFARPATPEVLTHVNPDGTVVEFRMHGDEHFNYITDISETQILEFKGNALVPYVRNGNAMKATPTNIEQMRATTDLMPYIERPEAKANGNVHRMPALDQQGRTTYPTIGEVHGLVILLEFPDYPYTMEDPKAYYNRFCNEEGFSDYGAIGSAKDYYIASSNGKFNPTFDVYGPVKLKHNAKWYVGKGDEPGDDGDSNLYNYGHNARLGCAIQEAFEALDDEIDFSKYDLDNDGNIDNIFFFYSGYGQADTNNKDFIWPHQWDFLGYTNVYSNSLGLERLYADGVEMRTYACTNELNNSREIPESKRPWVDGIGSFCHEYGHVLGLPDLYDTNVANGSCKNPGKYTVMCDGSYNMNSTCPPLFSAYEQWVCNWLDYTTAEDGTMYTVKPLVDSERSAVKIRVPRPGSTGYYSEYFVVECRDNNGWDQSLPETGMYIWRINYNSSVWANNKVNDTTPNVELLSRPDDSVSHAWPGDFFDAPYILPSQNVLVASGSTKKVIDATISRINYDFFEDNVLTFGYNVDQVGEDVTVMHDKPLVDRDRHFVYLEWDPVEGATDYALTLYSTGTNGKPSYIEGLNEKYVGTGTSYKVQNIKEDKWGTMFTAYVRVIKGVPSSKTSNTINFTPMRMTDISGVAEIDAEATPVYGGKGCIFAPDAAKVYNLSGVETGRENLPAGIYIVVLDGASKKVVVK